MSRFANMWKIYILFLVTLLTQILDICLSRSCFPQSDKQSLSSWRHKILALWGPLSNSQHPGLTADYLNAIQIYDGILIKFLQELTKTKQKWNLDSHLNHSSQPFPNIATLDLSGETKQSFHQGMIMSHLMFQCMLKIISNIPPFTYRGRVLQIFTVLVIIQLMKNLLHCSRNGIVSKKELLSLIIR